MEKIINNPTVDFTYTLGAGSKKYNQATVSFVDAYERAKKIQVHLNQVNCEAEDLSLIEWRAIAGLNNIDKDVPHPVTGIAWHVDQNDNIFFSGRFGYEDAPTNTKERRWMITNLAATSFVPNAYRTGSDNVVIKNMEIGSINPNSYSTPFGAYPNYTGNGTDNSTYLANPRVGLLYNWAAATNSKGGADGRSNYDEREENGTNSTRRQGICPSGWHLPSDYEWTELELEINKKTSDYSNLPNANGIITVGIDGWRGATHGQAMKDVCPPKSSNNTPNGNSNNISETKSGFAALLLGFMQSSSVSNYGISANFWTSSGFDTYAAMIRRMQDSNKKINRVFKGRDNLLSIRCKKD